MLDNLLSLYHDPHTHDAFWCFCLFGSVLGLIWVYLEWKRRQAVARHKAVVARRIEQMRLGEKLRW